MVMGKYVDITKMTGCWRRLKKCREMFHLTRCPKARKITVAKKKRVKSVLLLSHLYDSTRFQ